MKYFLANIILDYCLYIYSKLKKPFVDNIFAKITFVEHEIGNTVHIFYQSIKGEIAKNHETLFCIVHECL